MSTTITVSKRTKSMLEKVKARLERELGKKLTWNEFLERVALKLGAESILELSDEEAEIIARLTAEGRESWRRSV